jgi:hypothetical protein
MVPMRISGRIRLICRKMWVAPTIGLAIDLLEQDLVRILHTTPVRGPWAYTEATLLLSVMCLIARWFVFPEAQYDEELPDPVLTRRSRELGERLGAPPVRVYVGSIKRFGSDQHTFADGEALVISKQVADLPSAQRDFIIAKALMALKDQARRRAESRSRLKTLVGITIITGISRPYFGADRLPLLIVGSMWLAKGPDWLDLLMEGRSVRSFGLSVPPNISIQALTATGDPNAAVAAIAALAGSSEREWKSAVDEENYLLSQWVQNFRAEIEQCEWYRREVDPHQAPTS